MGESMDESDDIACFNANNYILLRQKCLFCYFVIRCITNLNKINNKHVKTKN